MRICGDYKVGVNYKICTDSYPIPDVETVLHALAGSKYFTKIDLRSAYNQIQIDEKFQEITTINTPIGLLRWCRMPYGIKTASSIFQRAIESVLTGQVESMIIYQDDILLGAVNLDELKRKTKLILKRLQDAGMTINEEKCIFNCESISYLGLQISKDGISPDPSLLNKIASVSTPTNKKELESFLGLVNFYSRYLHKYSDLVEPFSEIRKKNSEFSWNKNLETAFIKLKDALMKKPVVKIFDPKKEVVLTTDASGTAVSAILAQENHPFMYLSRKLTKAEMNYSNIEREALAIVWATQRARQFLLGRKFLLKSDHRPLEFIFNPRKELPKMTSARIMRWAIKLMAFDFDILYVKGNTIPHVDALSRLNFDQDEEENDGEDLIHWVETDVLQAERIRKETKQDPILNGIANRIKRNTWSNCSKAERPYKENRHKLTMDRGILCNGDLLVPPQSMRKEIIKSVHDDTHCGVAATQKRLKLEVWWPGYVRDVQNYVDKCPKCKEIKDFTPQSTHKWPSEGEPWNRVHMDHAHVNGIGLFLILVDSYSGWPEVIKVKDRKPITIQQVLRVIFPRNGVPKTLVSNNAPEFCEKVLCAWLTKIGCKPYKTPPYHPQSNGIAERMVRTVKLGLKAFDPSRETLEEFLPKLLMSYRSIPHANRTRSPSALMGRQIRSPITMSFSTN